jgi:hypothetical protein
MTTGVLVLRAGLPFPGRFADNVQHFNREGCLRSNISLLLNAGCCAFNPWSAFLSIHCRYRVDDEKKKANTRLSARL